MVGQSDAVFEALSTAMAGINEENRYSPGVSARVAVRALYAVGMKPGELGHASKVVANTVKRITQDKCNRYDIDGARREGDLGESD